MSKSEVVFYLASLVLLVVPLLFIANDVYEDGIIGRLALGCIATAAFAVLGQAAVTYLDAWLANPNVWHLMTSHSKAGDLLWAIEIPKLAGADWRSAGYHIVPEEAFMAAAFAAFLCWHLVRFHRRVLRAPPIAPCGITARLGCPAYPRPK